jgi:prepilin-type N-terminal cleavage/methylation domain-containing protein
MSRRIESWKLKIENFKLGKGLSLSASQSRNVSSGENSDSQSSIYRSQTLDLVAAQLSGSARAPEHAAFSLVEVLVAILVLGIALTGLTQALSTALKSHKESELQTTAALLAAGQIETVRAEGYLHDGDTDGDFAQGLSLYRWRQTISPAGVDGLHEVAVVVENAKTGKDIYELRTMLFEPPADTSTEKKDNKRGENKSRRRGAAR